MTPLTRSQRKQRKGHSTASVGGDDGSTSPGQRKNADRAVSNVEPREGRAAIKPRPARSSQRAVECFSRLPNQTTSLETDLWGKTLEESRHALLLDHVLDNVHSTHLRVEVCVLDTGLHAVSDFTDSELTFTTSRGAATVMDATAPAMEATKSDEY